MSAKKGSALLIVLGMLSFMVISAVSFSIYMRQSRMPSSYLRRVTSSRLLLKAALANAIDRIDGSFESFANIGNPQTGNTGDIVNGRISGVYDDVYPGILHGISPGAYNEHNGNYWPHRVFSPFGLVSPGETVSTLTLEGLAYLPPALINEARVFSRYTRTAMWRSLAYDAGRYAFCAINVSDCFDINKVLAGGRRSSAANERVNLVPLYPDNGKQLDTLFEKGANADVPFVSVADFNIMSGKSPFTPFSRYITSSGEAIYSQGDHQSVSNALFITDTWFPPTNATGVTRFNLAAGAKNQPFWRLKPKNASFTDMMNDYTEGGLGEVLEQNIGSVGLACLYDYLDPDSLPLSLCLPTVETAPMVCGIGFDHQAGPRLVKGETVEGEYAEGDSQMKWTATKYKLTFFENGMLTVLATMPFKRLQMKKNYKTSFDGEALVRVFLGPKGMNSRIAENSPLYPTKENWNDTLDNGLYTVKAPLNGLSFSKVTTTESAVQSKTVPVNLPSGGVDAFWHVTVKRVNKETGAETEARAPYYSFDGLKETGLAPRDENGHIVDWWKNMNAGAAPTGGNGKQPPTEATAAGSYVPHIAVWVRLTEGGETVDCVPARRTDDEYWGRARLQVDGQEAKFGGQGVPILEFRAGDECEFVYNISTMEKYAAIASGKMLDSTWSALYAVDPRYNYAPEDWVPYKTGGGVQASEWLSLIGAKNGGGVLGTNDRDRDIFMFTSDQGYLQSIGELAFLPYVQEVNGSCDFFNNEILDRASSRLSLAQAKDFRARVVSGPLSSQQLDQLANGPFMWRTYSPLVDNLYAFRANRMGGNLYEVVSGQNDFRVNPYTQDARILMAALKDTPFDYYVASTNDQYNATYDSENPAEYAFCDESAEARLDDEDLHAFASALRSRFRSSGASGASWESAFDALDWESSRIGDEQKDFLGTDLQQALHGVDRKYLYAFWRECFQNRQQLFLVFLRAEPQPTGAGVTNRASSQMGARGVALVWRDPAPPQRAGGQRKKRTELTTRSAWLENLKACAPHRTRVLFYHQFD
jgi:hypothetical protein